MSSPASLLQDFGLSVNEADLFIRLTQAGPSTAVELSRVSGLGRIQTYRVLQGLLDRALVVTSLERPRRFSAIDLEKAIELLTNDSRKRLQELDEKKSALISQWMLNTRAKKGISQAGFRLIHGSKNISRLTGTLYGSASKGTDGVVSSTDLLRSITYGLDDILEKKASQGVKVRRISCINERNVEAAKRYLQFSELRHTSSPGVAWIRLIDDGEVLVSLTEENEGGSSNEIALWTDSKEFVTITHRFFEGLWRASQDAEERIREIETGKSLAPTRHLKMGIPFYARIPQIIETSKSDLLLLCSEVGLNRLARDFDFGSTVERGVRVRVLADVTEDNIASAAMLAKCCEVRHSGPRFVELVISDGREALGTVFDPSSLIDEEALTKEGFYSSSDSYLRISKSVFMDMWKNAMPLGDRIIELKTGSKSEEMHFLGTSLMLSSLLNSLGETRGGDDLRSAMRRSAEEAVTQELKTARWEALVGDPEGALRAFARGQRVLGANSNLAAEDGTLELTLSGCKIGQLVRETPHLCDLEEMYLDSLMKRTGAKGAQRTQCLAEGDELCRYQVELKDGNGNIEG